MALKVYRTPIGFHDAYVAAPSQKAALAAWGADANLFARGVAELVTDPALTAEPLAHPGAVIKRLRGSAAEQLAAAPPLKKKPTRKQAASAPALAAKAASPPPRPQRAEVEAAEAVLAKAEAAHREAEQALAAEEQALAERRRALRTDWLAEREKLEDVRDAAEARYVKAMEKWRAAS